MIATHCHACWRRLLGGDSVTYHRGHTYCDGCAPDTTREEVQVSEGEGLGDRLEWIVELSRQAAGGPRASREARVWRCDGFEEATDAEACQRVVALTACAIRELDGQRHELRREVERLRDVQIRLIEESSARVREVMTERDAAIARAEAAEAHEQTARDLAVARYECEQLRRIAEPLLPVAADVAGILNDSTVESFDEWHARECPNVQACKSLHGDCICDPCDSYQWPDDYGSEGRRPWAPRFAGRTCRAVYGAEVPGRAPRGEEGGAG